MQSYLFLLFSYLVVSAAALSTPPAGAITVGGSSGKYKTLSAALKDTSSLVSGCFTPRSSDGVLTGLLFRCTSCTPGHTQTRRLLLGRA